MPRENNGTAVTKTLYICVAFSLSVLSNHQKSKFRKYRDVGAVDVDHLVSCYKFVNKYIFVL